MKQFLTTFGKFILFAFVAYCLILFVWGKTLSARFKPNLFYNVGSYGYTFTRLKEVKNIENIDILFLGSSHTYRGFDTRIFSKNGYKTFNLGSSAQTPLQTKALLKRYLEKLNPKLVIYEVYPATLTIDGVESTLDIISNDQNDFNSIEMAFASKNMKVYNTLLYGFENDLLKQNEDLIENKIGEKDSYVSGGFVERNTNDFKKRKFSKSKWKFNSKQVEIFKENIQTLEENNIKVIFVYAPIRNSMYKSFTNNQEFNNIIKEFGEYYNFNEKPFLNDTLHFYDKDHLNQEGVTLFNQKLIELLKSKK